MKRNTIVYETVVILIENIACDIPPFSSIGKLVIEFLLGSVQGDLARTVQSVLFVSAINTLVQTYLGSRLPVVMGNSFYFLTITLAIVNRPGIIDNPDPHQVRTLHISSLYPLFHLLGKY